MNSITAAATGSGKPGLDGSYRGWGEDQARNPRTGSRSKVSGGLDAADYITAGVGRVGFTDVGQGFGVGEYIKGLLKLSQVDRADQHGDRSSVTGDGDAFMMMFDTVDHVTEVVSYLTQRLSNS